jgi:hypothetical protein
MNAPEEGLPAQFNLEINSHQLTPGDHEQSNLQALQDIEKKHHLSPEHVILEFNQLSLRNKYIDLYDFIKLNLWNPAYIGDSDKTAYIGEQAQLKFTFRMYYDLGVDGYHITLNKVASHAYFAAMGLPVIPIKAVYLPLFGGRERVLHSAPALTSFLANPEHYPLFGKPVRYAQSLGSAGLKSVSDRTITTINAQTMPIDVFVDEITRYFSQDGYLFQTLRTNHPSLHPILGRTLATLRVVTILTEEGFKVFRAAWKIPGQHNFADNYWRTGNLIAGIDIQTGTITHVVSGSGLDLQEHTHHPQTKAHLIGYQVPQWEEVMRLALQGSRLFPRLPLMGWDLALSDEGLVIVEANDLPDFGIMQLADKRGMLAGEEADDLKRTLAQYEK